MVQLTVAATFALCAGSALASCHYGTSHFKRENKVPVFKFGYTGLIGPLNWYGLNPNVNKLCATGTHQSPINLNGSTTTSPGSSVSFQVDGAPNGSVLENLGTTLEVPGNGTLVHGGKTYHLVQFHFHTPSEHFIESEYSVMEVHFVFQADDKSLTAVGFLIDLGPTTPFLSSVFQNVDQVATPGSDAATGPLCFTELENHLKNNNIYTQAHPVPPSDVPRSLTVASRYSGSLTTPPCAEGVSWIVSSQPLHIDADTYHKVKDIIRFNARYIQNVPGGVNLLQNAANYLQK
ncbi:hypothetical protein DCS_08268 [Drechmeria coniospora]|uniref:carbonic anhydrase n=1 Tax=Drechmeria coniospora TaxID=98403 RepID=A0A151GGR9_DRECN|nr:hypothetical protein DCS_08268 [Drechmeria coniospora]KYK56298.1 hypothetical protein DCS_08268 [Drechmeria coniospora]